MNYACQRGGRSACTAPRCDCERYPDPEPHQPVTTLAELDALDDAEVVAGYLGTQRGDPEPGGNHTRSFHHGWRTRMMDLQELPIPAEHRALTRAVMARNRGAS